MIGGSGPGDGKGRAACAVVEAGRAWVAGSLFFWIERCEFRGM